jgi:hypothetical protein
MDLQTEVLKIIKDYKFEILQDKDLSLIHI